MELSGKIKNASVVQRRIEKLAPKIHTSLEQRVKRLTIALQTHVAAAKLSGQVLNVRTGRLRRSISQAVVSTETTITGVVSTPVEYAAAHEYGFLGVVTVKEHLRQVTQAFGKPLKEPVTATVREHSMHMHFPPTSFLRSALKDMRDEILEEINQAVSEGVKK
jgi:phage gpG-like protein